MKIPRQNLTSNQIPVKIKQVSPGVSYNLFFKKNDIKVKGCKYKNENGLCSKSLMQCKLLEDLFY